MKKKLRFKTLKNFFLIAFGMGSEELDINEVLVKEEVAKKEPTNSAENMEYMRLKVRLLASGLPDEISFIKDFRELVSYDMVFKFDEKLEKVKNEVLETIEKIRNVVREAESRILREIDLCASLYMEKNYPLVNSLTDTEGILRELENHENAKILMELNSLSESTDRKQLEKGFDLVNRIHEYAEKIKKNTLNIKQQTMVFGPEDGKESKTLFDKLTWKARIVDCVNESPTPPSNLHRIGKSTLAWDMPKSVKPTDEVVFIFVDGGKRVLERIRGSGSLTEYTLQHLDPWRIYNVQLKIGWYMQWSEFSNSVIIRPSNYTGVKDSFQGDVDFHWKEAPFDAADKRSYKVSSYLVENINNYFCTAISSEPFPQNASFEVGFHISGMKKMGRSMFVGVAQKGIDQSAADNYARSGWYVHCFDGTLYSGPPHNYMFPGKQYSKSKKGAPPRLKEGSIVLMNVSTYKGTISFSFDGNNLGTAYTGVPLDVPLYIAAILCYKGDSIELL